MRLTLTASLVLCGLYCTGCESLNKTALWPNKNPAIPEQLANDSIRREATAKQAAIRSESTDKAIQQANFAPANAGAGTELDAMLLRAKQAEEAHENQIAGAMYEQILQKQPQNAEAHHRLGVLADQAGRYQDAQRHYQLALQQNPQNASLLSDIGYSYYSQDRLNEAEHYLTAALQFQPQNQYARNNLAHVYGRRAQQSGSASDYKLAQEQFMLALGPQGAEEQMKQFFPQGAGPALGADIAPDKRRGVTNPFQMSDKAARQQPGRNLQAPNPKDGNQELVRQMDQIRREMEAAGQLPKRSDNPADRNLGARAPAASMPSANVPLDRMNQALSDIDHEAARQQNQVRQNNPVSQPNRNQAARPNWNQPGAIEQVGGWNDPQAPAVQPLDRFSPNGGGATVWDERSASTLSNDRLDASPVGWNASSQKPGDPRFANQVEDIRPNPKLLNGMGNPNQYQNGFLGQRNDPNPNAARNEEAVPGFSQQSWPPAQGSAAPTDARGPSWDGVPIVNDSVTGRDSNSAYVANDPTYRTGNGQPFGPQRPSGSARNNASGPNLNVQAGWDGRQVAAELGLDAGMGEMFPSGNGQGTNGMNQQWPTPTRPQLDTFMTTDPYLSPTATTPRGMSPGGNGLVSPADYNYASPDYQNGQYSQGVTPAMGENYGPQGGDVSAPWNQPGTTQRNSRSIPQSQQSQWGTDAGASQGRFAPSRQSNPPPQNFGAPPMYYGR